MFSQTSYSQRYFPAILTGGRFYWPSETGGPASFFYNFNDTISQEEQKTTNQNDFLAFFRPWKVS